MDAEIASQIRTLASNDFRLQLNCRVDLKLHEFDNLEAAKVYMETGVDEVKKVLGSKELVRNDSQSTNLLNESFDRIELLASFLKNRDMVAGEGLATRSDALVQLYYIVRGRLDDHLENLGKRMVEIEGKIRFYGRCRVVCFLGWVFVLVVIATLAVTLAKPEQAIWANVMQGLISVIFPGAWVFTDKYIKYAYVRKMEVQTAEGRHLLHGEGCGGAEEEHGDFASLHQHSLKKLCNKSCGVDLVGTN